MKDRKKLRDAFEAMAKNARQKGVVLSDREIDAEIRAARKDLRARKNASKTAASSRH